MPGITIPINPKKTNKDPKPMNKYFLINFLAYLKFILKIIGSENKLE